MTAIAPLHGSDNACRLAAKVAAAPRLVPFSQPAKAALAELSRRILAAPDLARRAEAVALGFWLRPANVATLEKDFAALARPDALRVPVGLALHFPPANVDTMPLYSWALSLLAGNHNIVRLSGRRGDLATRLVELAGEIVAAEPELSAGNVFVQYGHDDATSAALSAACDLRVIWGGNASVAKVRAIPLSPYAKEIAFADRLSLVALSAAVIVEADESALSQMAQGLFNDVYSFDQMGCSSPRLLVWVGTPEHARTAAERLGEAMEAELARRGHHVDPALAVAKLVFACGLAADSKARAIRHRTTDWMIVNLGDGMPSPLPHDHCGGGLLLSCRVDELTDIAPAMDRSVQTLTHYGFEIAALKELAHACAGHGVDRMVPVGEALTFGPLWDGYDLWNEFTRVVQIGGPVRCQHS